MLTLPEDIRDHDVDAFVLGAVPDDETSDLPELDIDNIFAKSVRTIVADGRAFESEDPFAPEKFTARRSSSFRPELTFVTVDYATLLLDADDVIVGLVYSSDISLESEYQGEGIGAELAVEHFLDTGGNPVWGLDSAQYTQAGYATYLAAHDFPRNHRQTYVDKLLRLALIHNPCLEPHAEEIRVALTKSTIAEAREEITQLASRTVPSMNQARAL